jgi:hypothetical protein
MSSLALARAVHLYTAAIGVLLPPSSPFDDDPPSRSFCRRAVSALFFDPALLALVPHSALGTVSSLAHLPVYAAVLPNMVYPLLYATDLTSEAAYLELMHPFVLWRVAPCATTPLQTLETLIDRCFGVLATTSDAFTGIDLTHLSRFERRVGYADLGVRIHLAEGRVAAVDVPDAASSLGSRRAALDDDRAIRRCTSALLTSATVEMHLASIHLALSDRICTLLRAVPKSHAVRRLLLPLTNSPFLTNELAVSFLIGPRGVCDWTNFTQRGVLDIAAHATANLDPSWLLLGHAGECGSVAAHMQAWRASVRAHVRAFLHLHPSIDHDTHAASFVAAFARAFPRLQKRHTTLEDACTMALLVPVSHEPFSNPLLAVIISNPFGASFIWRDAPTAAPLASHLPTLAAQLRVNAVFAVTMLETARIDNPAWVELCCVTADERAAYAAFQRSVAALDIPSDAVLHPTNISSSVSY